MVSRDSTPWVVSPKNDFIVVAVVVPSMAGREGNSNVAYSMDHGLEKHDGLATYIGSTILREEMGKNGD